MLVMTVSVLVFVVVILLGRRFILVLVAWPVALSVVDSLTMVIMPMIMVVSDAGRLRSCQQALILSLAQRRKAKDQRYY